MTDRIFNNSKNEMNLLNKVVGVDLSNMKDKTEKVIIGANGMIVEIE